MEKRHEHSGIHVPSFKLFHAVVILVLVVQAFFLGSLWTKVEVLKGGGVVTQQQQAGAQQPAAPVVAIEQVKEAFGKSLIKFGDANKKVVFIEVADPSCPYCHAAAGHNPSLNTQMGGNFILVADGGTYVPPVQEMKKLVDSGDAAFAYLYTPGHGNGEMGTKAMYCAHEMGKFWEAHDLLMTSEGYALLNDTVKNDKAKSDVISQFLGSAVNAAQMKECLDSGKYDQQLSADVAVASSLGVSGTPGFFVNENKFAGAYSYKDMESAVTSAL